MMRWLGSLHRWTGGLIGLALAVLGLSGALLVHRDLWTIVDGQPVPPNPDLAMAVAGVLGGEGVPRSLVFASRTFPFHKVSFGSDAGAYVDATGTAVARWSSVWDRPELWLLDLHHYLLAGEAGEVVAGISALFGVLFVISGLILWWPTRRTFRLRAWPARATRPAIVRHHRDLGVLVAPLLLLSFLTGAMMTLDPVRNLLLRPWSSAAEMKWAAEPPRVAGAALSPRLPWGAMFAMAAARFPEAEPRVLSLPRDPGDPVTLRLKNRDEWLPNGRTTVWFRPDTGAVLAARDERSLPAGSRLFNLVYPLHAAKVGGWPYRIAMTLVGVALAMLGSLTVWSFWFRRPVRSARRPMRNRSASTIS